MADPFPPFPHRFVRDGFDPASVRELEACFDELERRTLSSSDELEKWLLDWSELSAVLSEEESRRYVEHTRRTDDPRIEKRYLDFQAEVLPFAKPRWQRLKEKYASSPLRLGLDRARYGVLDRTILNELDIFRPENVELERQDAEMIVEWQRISGAMTVFFEGGEHTVPQMNRFLEEPDRSRRERAWRAVAARRLKDRDAIDGLYARMVENRHRRARHAGFPDFRAYAFREKGRFDYSPDDCLRFHEAVEELTVPLLRRLHAHRRSRLGVETLRPWDLAVDPEGAPPLRPFRAVDELFAGVRSVFERIDPHMARLLEAVRSRGHLDLESRKGKAPGGYMMPLDDQRVPFIFMNAAGLHRDVMTLLHEGGHALHTVFARDEPLTAYRMAPLEFCEVASMGMEALGLEHLGVFYDGPEARRARREYFEGVVRTFSWIATIDAFQHRVYLEPELTPAERRDAWLAVRKRFSGEESWAGLEEEHATLWHAQMHPFCVPFYYIEYAIAQIGALQIWLNARRDVREAVDRYRRALALGGSRPLPDLFRAAGCAFGLDRAILAPLMAAVDEELSAHE